MCTLCALIFYIRTHTHIQTVCVCVFARISIVCTLCDIFMRPNFVASNLRCVWVTTAVAISLPHLWQIFSLCCRRCCCCCFASQTTCVVKSTLAFISHQATTPTHNPQPNGTTNQTAKKPQIHIPWRAMRKQRGINFHSPYSMYSMYSTYSTCCVVFPQFLPLFLLLCNIQNAIE